MTKGFGNKDNYTVNGQFNITAFLMDASLIVNKIGIESSLKSVFIDSAVLRYLPEDINRDLVKKMIDEHGALYAALYRKQQDNKHDVVDSKFVKISDTEFIEKRDNKFYFLDYDERTGVFSEKEMTGEYGDTLMRFSKETVDKFGGSVRRLTYMDRKTAHTIPYRIMFNEDFSMVTVNGKEFDVIGSPMQLGDRFLVDEVMKPISDGIRSGKYVSVLDDGEAPIEGVGYTCDIDTRSRVINYKLFLKELRANALSIPKELYGEMEKSAIGNLISKTYSVRPENMEELQRYISGICLKKIDNKAVVDKLYEYTEQLNQARRSHVEKESQYSAVYLGSDEAKCKWTESLEAKSKRKKQVEFNQSINAFIAIDSMSCVTRPLEVRTDKGHYSTMDGVEYRTSQSATYRTALAGKVDYEAFCDKLEKAVAEIDEDKREKFINRVIDRSINNWYGGGSGYQNADKINDERYDLDDRLKEIIVKKVIDGEEIDMQEIDRTEQRYLELSAEEEAICQRVLDERSPISFESDAVKKEYEVIESIHGLEMPDESKTVVIHELKEKSQINLDEKRRMDSFARLALGGDHTPSDKDIRNATNLLDFHRDRKQDVSRD